MNCLTPKSKKLLLILSMMSTENPNNKVKKPIK